jgi:hypothetical protein
MKSRTEYVRCIQHTHAEREGTSWCGKKIFSFDWVFQDIDHATYATLNGSRQVPCPNCVSVIISSLENELKGSTFQTDL